MSQQGTIKRYSLIIKKVEEDFYPNFKQLTEYLHEKGFEVSGRTIQRDIEQLDAEFGLKISYSRQHNGYFIAEEDKIQLEPFMKFMDVFHTAEVLRDSLANSRETLDCIAFDTAERMQGIEFLQQLLQALREKRPVSFNYKTFFEAPPRRHSVHPYLLKEYQNRWYLVACYENAQKLYVFGLDRIAELKISDEQFVPDPKIDPRRKFRDIIGITAETGKMEKVVLSFTPQQGNYVKALPLHHSQKPICDNDKEFQIELYLVPNFELEQKILMHGELVKVLKPAWLARNIKRSLQQALEQYT